MICQVSEVEAALQRLAASGDELVPNVMLGQIDSWLARPAWLYEGVGFLIDTPDLPAAVRVRDKARVLGNLLLRLDFHELVDLFFGAMQWPMGRLGGLLCTYAPDLGAAVDALVELNRISNPHVKIHDVAQDGARRLEIQAPDLGPIELAAALGFAFQMHRFLHSRAGTSQGRIELGFTWSGPVNTERLPTVERADLRLGAPANSVAYPLAWNALRNPMYDGAHWDMGLRMSRGEAARLREQSVIALVRRTVKHSIGNERRPPSIRDVAIYLGKSVRSLERDLADAGTTFRAIVEDERKQFAAAMLSEPHRSIQEISDLLGYADRTSFTRSFRAWFKVPPAAFRFQLSAGPQAS